MWINKDYCKNGYAYLSPFNSKKASVILVVTDVNEKEIDHYWKAFLDYENINYTIVEEFKQAHDTGLPILTKWTTYILSEMPAVQ